MESIYRRSLRAPRVPLLSGRDVMEALGIEPGPEVGRRLAEIRDLQDGGVVATREQALAYLRRSSGG